MILTFWVTLQVDKKNIILAEMEIYPGFQNNGPLPPIPGLEIKSSVKTMFPLLHFIATKYRPGGFCDTLQVMPSVAYIAYKNCFFKLVQNNFNRLFNSIVCCVIKSWQIFCVILAKSKFILRKLHHITGFVQLKETKLG